MPFRAKYPEVQSVENLSRNCRNSGNIFDMMRVLYPSPPPTDEQLKNAGAVRFFPFTRNERSHSVSLWLAWLLFEGFDGEYEVATANVIALHGGTTPVNQSPLIGSFTTATVNWQLAVLNEFRAAVRQAETLAFPPGIAEIECRLSSLSSSSYPTKQDIELVRTIANDFTVATRTRRLITNRPGGAAMKRWIVSDGMAKLSRSGFDSFRASELISHFQSDDWDNGLPEPRDFTFRVSDERPTPGHIPVSELPMTRVWSPILYYY